MLHLLPSLNNATRNNRRKRNGCKMLVNNAFDLQTDFEFKVSFVYFVLKEAYATERCERGVFNMVNWRLWRTCI